MTVRIKNVKDIHPTPFGHIWLEMVEVLNDHVIRKHKIEGPLWLPSVYIGGTTHCNNGVVAMSAFLADLDGESLDGARERLNRYRHCAYTTYSHATGDEHWRVFLPFAHEIGAGSWRSVWQWCHRELGLNCDEVIHIVFTSYPSTHHKANGHSYSTKASY